MGSLLILYVFVNSAVEIMVSRKYDFVEKKIYYLDKELEANPVNLGVYNGSMNFAYGFAYMDASFDPLDNPYVNFKAYKMKKGLTLSEADDY